MLPSSVAGMPTDGADHKKHVMIVNRSATILQGHSVVYPPLACTRRCQGSGHVRTGSKAPHNPPGTVSPWGLLAARFGVPPRSDRPGDARRWERFPPHRMEAGVGP